MASLTFATLSTPHPSAHLSSLPPPHNFKLSTSLSADGLSASKSRRRLAVVSPRASPSSSFASSSSTSSITQVGDLDRLSVYSAATGNPVAFSELWKPDEVAVVALMRHFGCFCCWELASVLKEQLKPKLDSAGVKLIAIGVGTTDKAQILAERPVVFLHGGPGAGTSPGNRTFFDPEFYRIILFDQRGAGKSTPHACLEENTTWDLVEDIEKLRVHLDIPEWQVFGGSWGSTLALTYSQVHPGKVTGIVLRGIFLLRKKELDWFYEGGAAAIFPDAWESYRDFIPENERSSFIDAYHKRLHSNDPDLQNKAAKLWTRWEMMTTYLVQNEENIKRGEDDLFSLAFARIENHYFINKGFFPSDSYLLDNIEKIHHIDTVIVQGRYDCCCPMMSAWDLHKAWPEAEFKVVPDAGHSANEPGIASELVAANEKLKHKLKRGSS